MTDITRLFYQQPTRKWLRRIDVNAGEAVSDTTVSAAAAFAVPADDIDPRAEFAALTTDADRIIYLAQRMGLL